MDASTQIADIEARLAAAPAPAPGLAPEAQLALLTARTEQVISPDDLLRKLKKGQPLKVKLGIDPTATMIHVGHYIAIRKMRLFQRLGHELQLVIGSFTAMIGDTSDKNSMRPALTAETVEENLTTYLDQLGKYLELSKTEVRKNGEWFFNMKLVEFLPLMMQMTIQQVLGRETFAKRYDEGSAIGLHEAVYPLLQGYDSVMLQSDVELGGTDQLFNILRGRELQPGFGQEPQVVMILPLLIGTDGRKMSKSYGNVIALTDTPEDAYGKLLSVADEHLAQYAMLLTDMTDAEWKALEAAMRDGLNPKEVKMLLARLIVGELHGREAAVASERQWVEQFSEGKTPEEMPKYEVSHEEQLGSFTVILEHAGAVPSRSEARRLLTQGAVTWIKNQSSEETLDMAWLGYRVTGEYTLRIGKRRWLKLIVR